MILDLLRKMMLIFIVLLSAISVNAQNFEKLSINKARYAPADTVKFSAEFSEAVSGKLSVSYYHLADKVDEVTINLANQNSADWEWITPTSDYKGYLAVVNLFIGDDIKDSENIAVDVSSDWAKFPRYGFISDYTVLNSGLRDDVLSKLNRYHINALQFYDWQYKHHMPLKGTVSDPAYSWFNIANRTVYYWTVKYYIDEAHVYNMNCNNYNLLYGAYEDASVDGVSDEWRLYKDTNHQEPWLHDLPDSWASDIYLMDPSNSDWRNYLYAQEATAFEALDFDGFHIDQLGDLGTYYNYSGQEVDVNAAFKTFIEEAKTNLNKDMIMNAVGQNGQSYIVQAPVDILYTEHWDDNTYADIVNVIKSNNTLSGYNLKTVLAAYMNYDHGQNGGTYFNEPGILYTDAAIFSEGGAHIELGEHMLHHEFYPANNLQMSDNLTEKLVDYYDFMVAYQNLLRDSVRTGFLSITSNYNLMSFPTTNSIWKRFKKKGDNDIIHLINFYGATHTKWKDRNATQTAPDVKRDAEISFNSTESIRRIWAATPDTLNGLPVNIEFEKQGNLYSLSVPYLEYWTMIVIEYGEPVSVKETNEGVKDFRLGQNYPNPFNPVTTIEYYLPVAGDIKLDVLNILGENVASLQDGYQQKGSYKVPFNAEELSSGLYFYQLTAGKYRDVKKMMLIK